MVPRPEHSEGRQGRAPARALPALLVLMALMAANPGLSQLLPQPQHGQDATYEERVEVHAPRVRERLSGAGAGVILVRVRAQDGRFVAGLGADPHVPPWIGPLDELPADLARRLGLDQER